MFKNKETITTMKAEQFFSIIYEDETGEVKKEIVSSPSQMWLIGEFNLKRPSAHLFAVLPVK